MQTEGCPGCSARLADPHEAIDGVVACRRCGGLYTTRPIYLGESYKVVLPEWADEADGALYFDLTVISSAGLERRHGWFDPTSRCILQVG